MINMSCNAQHLVGVCEDKQITGKKGQDCFRVDLDGNKTSLFVRETSKERLVDDEGTARKLFDDCLARISSSANVSSEVNKNIESTIAKAKCFDDSKCFELLGEMRYPGKQCHDDAIQLSNKIQIPMNPYCDPLSSSEICEGQEESSNGEKEHDFIQIDLDGNNTTLFVRDTSVVEFVDDMDEEKKSTDDFSLLFSSTKESRTRTVQSTSSRRGTRSNDDGQVKGMTYESFFMYDKKWSGKTYFEENIRKIKENEYQNAMREAESKRKLWKAYQKDIRKDRRRDLVRSSGPEWYQEPSRKQICLAISLSDVLITDYEEEVTGRTRQWLLDLGVTTRVTPKQVRACMRRSLLNPIDFLLETHSIILKSQMNVKKKRGDLERPFSVNERLLLTAVCVIHLPTLLTMLHFILPPPKPWSTEKHVQELLFGDLEDERIRYFTPYMEPLPFRSPTHFANWAFDNVFKALLPSVLADETIVVSRDQMSSPFLAIPGMKTSIINKRKSTNDKNSKSSSGKSSNLDSVTWLISHYISKREATASMFPFYDEEERQPKKFSRRLTQKSILKNKLRVFSEKEENPDQVMDEYRYVHGDGSVKKGKGTLIHFSVETQQSKREEGLEDASFITEESYSLPDKTESSISKPNPRLHSEDALSYQKETFQRESQVTFVPVHNPITPTQSKDHSMQKDINEIESNEPNLSEEPSESDLQKLWENINALPKNEQLKYAIQVLGEMGDPLSRLPKIHKLPSVKRWFELRQGKNRILSKNVKEDLLVRSRDMWKISSLGDSTQVPKVKCSKKVERSLTWNKKKWLSSEIGKEMKIYYSRSRQEKVDNARTFFPTMFNQYDHGSKLNRNFRDVFFTYMPAKETDTFVYKPWQPGESRGHA